MVLSVAMPQNTSVRPTNNNEESRSNDNAQRNVSGSVRSNGVGRGTTGNYPHMTLDGRRHRRHENNSGNNGADQWQDWTSTWRRIGAKGHSQPVTMTGTITRGKKKGQVVDVQLDLTDRELMEISTTHDQTQESVHHSRGSMNSEGTKSGCRCGLADGPHITLVSVIAFPFILMASLCASFYFGALTWQNIFNHFYDERTICHRILLCPLLVISFPVFIVLFTVGIAIYASFAQIRWSFMDWKDEVGSLEKGFYGWLCGKLDLEDCCPYTVVELYDSREGLDEHGTEAGNTDGEVIGGARGGDRVAVVYTERESNQQHAPNRLQQQHTQRDSLPLSTQVQVHAQRVESTL